VSRRAFAALLGASERGAFAGGRKFFWRQLYNVMSRVWRDRDWRFMNYGYIAPGQEPFALDVADEQDRAFIGLYHQAVFGLDLKGKSILEVGSGRGGGASYIARYFAPAEMVGVDYSPKTVEIAQRLSASAAGLRFCHGDAERLPFADATFDVVVNIESSHCYADMAAFVQEAARVLKPGGVLTWADMRAPSMMAVTDQSFGDAPLALISEEHLGPGVALALEKTSDRKLQAIPKLPLLHRFMSEFAATKGTILFDAIRTGDALYLSRRYRKL
jgi:ubiquinone/menaquinone biosynthesis C-methylase UbiE